MTSIPPAAESSHTRLALPVESSAPALRRHPEDSWQLAEPYRMGKGARRALRALITAMLPPPPAPSGEEMVDRIEHSIRSWMPYMHFLAARGLWLSILILEWAPLLLLYRFGRFHTLTKEDGGKLLSEMVHGRYSFLRMLVVALRGVTLSAYFDQDEVHQAMQYAPVPFMRERIVRRQSLLRPAHAKAG